MAILISGGTIVTAPLEGRFEAGAVLIEGDRIGWVGARVSAPSSEVIDASGCWVLPGLIDAHTHLYSALAAGMPLKDESPHDFAQVLQRIWWRLDRALGPEDVRYSGYVGGLASLCHGVTTLFDHHASPNCTVGSLDILADVLQELGLRASLAYEVSDREGPASRDLAIEENYRFFQRCRASGSPFLKAHFGLHAVFTLSDETLRRCAEIGRAIGAGFHLHVLEHRAERLKFEAEHEGRSVVDLLADAGILSSDSIAAHVVHVTPADAQRLAQSGALAVHNPQSNMGNGVGIAPIGMLLDAGVRLGLGTDGYYDLPQQVLATPLLQKLGQCDPSALGVGDALAMVYGRNADLATQAFGLPFGRVAPGYAADLLVIPYDPATPVNAGNLSTHIAAALAIGPRHVLVGGKVRLWNGQVPGVDWARVKASARELAAQLWQRL